MSCQETLELIHGYVDGEVDLVKSLEIEAHLKGCHNCTANYEAIRRLRSVTGDSAVRFDLPRNLEKRLRAALRNEAQPDTRTWFHSWRWLMAGASLVGAAIIILAVTTIVTRPSAADLQAQEIRG